MNSMKEMIIFEEKIKKEPEVCFNFFRPEQDNKLTTS